MLDGRGQEEVAHPVGHAARTWLPPALSMKAQGEARPGSGGGRSRGRAASRVPGQGTGQRLAAAKRRSRRATSAHQRQQDEEVDQGGTDQRRRIGGERLGLRRLLEQVRHGDDRGERRVLHHVDAFRSSAAPRSAPPAAARPSHHQPPVQAERPGRLELPARHGLDAGAEDLGRVGGRDEREAAVAADAKGDSRMPTKGSA